MVEQPVLGVEMLQDPGRVVCGFEIESGVIDPALIDEFSLAVGATEPDNLRTRFCKVPKASLAGAQSGFDGLLLGNIAGDFRGADDVAECVPNRGDRKRDIQQCTVTMLAHGLEM